MTSLDPIAASIKLPNIVVETYQNKVTGDLTTGPAGTEVVNVDVINELSMVLSCPTSLLCVSTVSGWLTNVHIL